MIFPNHDTALLRDGLSPYKKVYFVCFNKNPYKIMKNNDFHSMSNEARRLVPDHVLFFKKALQMFKANGFCTLI